MIQEIDFKTNRVLIMLYVDRIRGLIGNIKVIKNVSVKRTEPYDTCTVFDISP